MPVDAAVFDVDGTVATCPYDFGAMRAAVADIAALWGIDAPSLGLPGIIEQIVCIAGQLAEEGPAFRAKAEAAVTAIEVAAARGATLLPGAAEALAELRAGGVAIALITRNSRAAAEVVLAGLRVLDVLLTRDDVPLAKPDPDHVLRALAALARSPATAIVVGDHDFDMAAGRAAGVRACIGVRTGTATDERLRAAGADAILDTIADLPAWLREQGDARP